MRDYELTLVLSGRLSEAKQKSLLVGVKKAVEQEGGKVKKTKTVGKRRLAYAIKKEDQGFYFLLNLSIPAKGAGGLNKGINQDEEVLRHLLVRR